MGNLIKRDRINEMSSFLQEMNGLIDKNNIPKFNK